MSATTSPGDRAGTHEPVDEQRSGSRPARRGPSCNAFTLVPDSVWTLVIGLVLLAILQWAPRPESVSTRVVPHPSDIWAALIDAFSSGAVTVHLVSTAVSTLGGFAVATILAVVTAAALVALPRLERILTPYIVGFQTLPKIAVAPLVILWMGFGDASKIAIVSFLSFFPIFVNCLQGFRIRDRVRFELFVSLGASQWQLLRFLRAPAAMPYLFAGLNVGMVFALVGSVVAEFVGSQDGMGVYLLQQKASFNVPGVFAALVVLAVFGLVLHFVIAFIERRATGWAAEVTKASTP